VWNCRGIDEYTSVRKIEIFPSPQSSLGSSSPVWGGVEVLPIDCVYRCVQVPTNFHIEEREKTSRSRCLELTNFEDCHLLSFLVVPKALHLRYFEHYYHIEETEKTSHSRCLEFTDFEDRHLLSFQRPSTSGTFSSITVLKKQRKPVTHTALSSQTSKTATSGISSAITVSKKQRKPVTPIAPSCLPEDPCVLLFLNSTSVLKKQSKLASPAVPSYSPEDHLSLF